MNNNIIDHSEILTGPLHIGLDITNKCMCKCLHCFNRSGDELIRNELTDEEFMSVISQIAEVKPFSICFCGGEPLMKYDRIISASKVLKEAGVQYISMVSNGYLMTAEKAKELKRAGINHIQISLDGACAESHEKMRGIKGIFERALNAMKYIDDEKINLAIAFCPTSFNIDEFPDMVKLVSQFQHLINIRVQPLMPMGKAIKTYDNIFPSENDYRKLVNYITEYNINSKSVTKFIEWGDPLDHLRRFSNLHFNKVSFVEIKSDGSLSISAYLPFRIGNLRKHTLKEYWDADMGKVWELPASIEIADIITCIDDMSLNGSKIPQTFYDENIMIDIIDDKPFEHKEDFTLDKLLKNLGGDKNAE